MMEIELVPEERFTARAGDVELHGLQVTSRWEGFLKLEDGQGRVLYVQELGSPLAAAMTEALGLGGRKYGVVRGSPELIFDLTHPK